jgi:iron complex transport system permease protein
MKVTLDLDRLLAEKRISAEEYRRFASLAPTDRGSSAVNILVGFGTIAVAGGTLAMVQSAQVSVMLGVVLSVAGVTLARAKASQWGLLGSILLLVGSLMAAGGVVALTEGSFKGLALATALFFAGAVLAESRLLAALTAFGILGMVGAASYYSHASYGIAIEHPTITIVLFSVLSAVAYVVSSRLPEDYEPLAIVFSRTCLFIVNLGFWIGSLWGDSLRPGPWNSVGSAEYGIPDWVFAVGWAVGLVAVGAWGIRRDRRFVVNLAATFAAIHFYTQWFARLGADPMSVILGGLLAIGIALALFKYNQRDSLSPSPAPVETS